MCQPFRWNLRILQLVWTVLFFLFSITAKADYTVASGSNINASTITGQSGVLTINGTLTVSSDVFLSGFTAVIINGTEGNILWTSNKDLRFNDGIIFIINNPGTTGGLQPIGGNAAKSLTIGTTTIAVSNSNSNNAAFSFDQFNAAGGLPQFTISASAATICYGASITATITPQNTNINYDCNWTVNNSGTVSPASESNFNTPKTATLTPTNSATAKTYVISCTLKRSGDADAITTKTITVTVNPSPAAPTSATATPGTICFGSSSAVKATSAGNSIQWFTANSGGTLLGTSASGANYLVSPTIATTYYAQALIGGGTGCTSLTRTAVAVAVNAASVGGTVGSNTTVCTGANSTTLLLSGNTGSVTRWESSIDNFATAATNINNTTNSLTVTNISTTSYYRAVVTSGVCAAANSSIAILSVSNPGTWLGINTDWNSGLNWCNGTLPTATTNVIINNGLANYPIITGTAFANNITVASGGAATVTISGTLKLAGAITSNNAVNATNGNIELIGNNTQTINADNFAGNTLANLIISNTKPLASAVSPSVLVAGTMLNISGTVLFGNVNNGVLQTNDKLTLLSSATKTASIGDVTNNAINSGNVVSGKVVIERYIPGRRAWRLLTAPVTSSSLVKISNSWQEGALPVTNPSNINSSNNPNSGYGTHITFGQPAINGYDQGVNGNTSIRYLTATGWDGVPLATNNGSIFNSGYVTDQPGYFLFVRGDRATQLSAATGAVTSPTILRCKGNINMGSLALPLGTMFTSGTAGFRVIGNPYPSTINFHKIATLNSNSTAGFADAFYIWDPNITGTNGVGGWVGMSYNNTTLTYDRNVLSGGSSSTDNSGDIQSGAAFMIDYKGSATTLTISEATKNNSSNNSVFRPAAATQQLRINLLAKNNDNTISVNDGALIVFDKSSTTALRKIKNFAENLGIIDEGELLCLKNRKPITVNDSIALYIGKMKQKNYQLQIEGNSHLPVGTEAFLEDRFLNKKIPFTKNGTTLYDFNIIGLDDSKEDRFRLIFVQSNIQFSTIKGWQENDDVVLNWTMLEEHNLLPFEIERSLDSAAGFTTIGILNSQGNSDVTTTYNFTDIAPPTGYYYYRIKSTNRSGKIVYSNLVVMKVISHNPAFEVFPNPVTNNTIVLHINRQQQGIYTAQLFNSLGQQLHENKFYYPGGHFTKSLSPSVALPNGNYQIQLISPNKTITLLQFIVVKN